MRSILLAVGAAAAAVVVALCERDANACGGCFHPPTESESVITDHRMVLTISSKETTLYDQIRYTGNPASFAWVLPISGVAKVGLSSDMVFSALDGMTATVVEAPPPNCPARPSDCAAFGKNLSSPSAPAAGADNGAVTVTKQETVGPFETVQLHADDPQALNTWLTTNGFAVPVDVQPIITQYVKERFDFLALKLKPGAGVQSMRPVRVTTAGAAPVLPLRMVAAGTGAKVGVTLWVVGEGRYEPQNFPFFQITADQIEWDWPSSSSNYKTLRAAKADALLGRGWEIESSMDLASDSIRNGVKYGYFGGNRGGGPVAPPGADADYLPIDRDGGVSETADQVREDDLAALLGNIPGTKARITRMRSDLNHAALNVDLSLQASKDQSPLASLRVAKLESGQPSCPIYNGCDMIGMGPRDQAVAAQANAANKSESFGCSSTSATSSTAPLGLFAAAGFLGFAALRARRRRP